MDPIARFIGGTGLILFLIGLLFGIFIGGGAAVPLIVVGVMFIVSAFLLSRSDRVL